MAQMLCWTINCARQRPMYKMLGFVIASVWPAQAGLLHLEVSQCHHLGPQSQKCA